MDFYIVLIK